MGRDRVEVPSDAQCVELGLKVMSDKSKVTSDESKVEDSERWVAFPDLRI